jgi:hypothetical protein
MGKVRDERDGGLLFNPYISDQRIPWYEYGRFDAGQEFFFNIIKARFNDENRIRIWPQINAYIGALTV